VSDDAKGYCTIDGEIVDNTISITVDNAYPCITVNGILNINNTGSVPAGLHGVKVTLPIGMTLVSAGGYYEVYLGDKLIAEFAYNIDGDIEQIDPGDVVYIDFKLHFDEGLPQGSHFDFSVELIYYNWNEAKPL
jgi:hypothetical protein